MVSIVWDNYSECIDVMGMDKFVKMHAKIMGVIQECGKKGF